jgi:maltose/moltooligosaccharide transporter
MEWLPMIGVGIAWASILSVPMRCYPVHYLLTKWAITWEFLTFIVIPQLVAASILGF